MKITINKLGTPFRCGDWHDKPMKWEVLGPGAERQMFPTKADAELFKRIRKQSCCQTEATSRYVLTP